MKWTVGVVVVLAIGTAQAQEPAPLLESYDNLMKKGYQIAGITPDRRGGQVYHMQKPGQPLYTCRATVLVQGLEPSMGQYCERVLGQ